jgi:lipopolysaccharide/colanic/teichoic acid biosynthesis glycosyltransferase
VALQRTIKQIADFGLALALLVILSPVFVIIAIAIKLTLGSPVLFVQTRPGKDAQIFRFYKFRTMTDARDSNGVLLSDAKRLTRLGCFLRRSSVDELPQLWNILKGEMSFVGPRPLLVAYLGRYTCEQARRHSVKPGITGWAQINGRQNLLFSQRLQLDIDYADHWSLWFDLKILLLTGAKVLKMADVKPGQDVREVDDIGLSDDIP